MVHDVRMQRGATLVELLVAGAVMGIVLALVAGVVQSQQAAYAEGHHQRAAQDSARAALSFLEQRLQLAGYGMDASLAFDFDRYAGPCPPLANGCPRDSVNGNDELVFYSRDPRYWVPNDYGSDPRGNAWRIVSVSGDRVTVHARKGDTFVAGRILQAVCKGASRYAYFTVRANARASDDAPLEIPLVASSGTDPFLRQSLVNGTWIQQGATDPCFSNDQARLFLVDRYRFHVRPVLSDSGYQPYLVLDTGLDADGSGTVDENDEIVVAEGIETFQVGYVMTSGALAPRGATPGTVIPFTPGDAGSTVGDGITTLAYPGTSGATNEYRPTSWYGYSLGPPPARARLTDHQANIRAVRISLVARAIQPNPSVRSGEVLVPVMNMDTLPGWVDPKIPYNRARLETTVLVRNMTARSMNDF